MATDLDFSLTCPAPSRDQSRVLLAHGGGGRLMGQLINSVFLAGYGNPLLENRHDGAVFELDGARLAFTTDSYVVNPLFFPGGDIGALAVNGTVNDLAMCGARPVYLSAGFILEEGLEMDTLRRVVESMRIASDRAGVQFVTGDTKVVDHGKGDGIFINTAGIGVIEHDLVISPSSIRGGDAILVSGDIGRHGIAIMAQREGLEFETTIESDCAPVNHMVRDLITAGIEIHCLRDLTRGGMASALVEIAESAGSAIRLEESLIPIREDVRGACEILGFDPLYVANEGRFVIFLPEPQVEHALEVLRAYADGAGSARIGHIEESAAGQVTLKTCVGVSRIVDLLSGEQLPRIC